MVASKNYDQQKNLKLALESYLAALEVKPDSFETKVNIELLMRQLQNAGQLKSSDQGGQSQSEDQSSGEQQYQESPKYEMKQEVGLNESDIKKILEELRNQEQKIRQEYSKKNKKDQPREKDW